MRSIFADLHIHIGSTDRGEPVKISASRNLTFANIAKEASERKGIELIGIIDCHSPGVLDDIERCLDGGEMDEAAGGGIRYRSTTILLGSEIEVRDEGFGAVHLLVYMRDLASMREFSRWMSRHMKNVRLSSQRLRVPARSLQREVLDRGGLLIPAHIFTPHKGLYGSGSDRMADLLDPDGVAAVELGLSADAGMAGWISELDRMPLLANSDAHSLGKIAREYNRLALVSPCFDEFKLALRQKDGRAIEANYGLHPRLGKYHRTWCAQCRRILDESGAVVDRCPHCGGRRVVRGVLDRIRSIADRDEPAGPPGRPPYHYQVPLEFVPGLGRRTLERLLERFGTEMNVLHRAPEDELAQTAGEKAAAFIVSARRGTLRIDSGGGGLYGKVVDVPEREDENPDSPS